MICKKTQALLALLFVGSASMMAEGYDPFPEVPASRWQGNMSLYAKVILDGVELDDNTIVAVYDGTQIRGKEWIDKNKVLSMTISGDPGEYPPIHFKVYTGGRIIEVDQGLTYQYYATIGKNDDPYIINLHTPVVTNTSAEGWATTCLPFNAAVPEGVTVYTASKIEDGVLKIEQVECTILPKETPVLLKTEGQKSYEWLSRVADGDANIENNLFKGTIEATTIPAESVLTLGHATDGNNEIGFWLYTGTNIPANRAYLERPGQTRGVTLNWENATGITTHLFPSTPAAPLTPVVWDLKSQSFDLQGRRFNGTGKIRITNGKKYLVR